MFIRTKPISNSKRKRIQICECYRDGDKVKQKVVRHIGIAENDSQLEELKTLAVVIKEQIKKERTGPTLFDKLPYVPKKTTTNTSVSESPSLQSPDKSQKNMVCIESLREEKRIVEGFHDIFGALFNHIGFHTILTKKQSEVLRDIVLARIACPASKLSSQRILSTDFGREIDLDRIYRMMDALEDQKDEVQKKVFLATEQLCFGQVDILLFDVTTLYFESTDEDDLRTFGYSKDQKFHTTQVVLALATASNGLPVGYKLFPGNTAEVSTLISCLENWKKTLPIGKVLLVADRAMMTEKNLCALEEAGIQYIVAAKLKKLPKITQETLLAHSHLKSSLVTDECFLNKRRLVVTFSESRKAKDINDRERILTKIKKKIGKGTNAKKLISNSGYQKYVSADGNTKLFLDEEKISQDARWDGLHGIITNCCTGDAEELLLHYRRLWVIEESFRIHKHNLSIRPIYHFKSERIEAHILICYMAFSLMRHLEFRMRLQTEKLSMIAIREELWRVQASILVDKESGKKYRLPSSQNISAKKIYQTMGIKRGQIVEEVKM